MSRLLSISWTSINGLGRARRGESGERPSRGHIGSIIQFLVSGALDGPGTTLPQSDFHSFVDSLYSKQKVIFGTPSFGDGLVDRQAGNEGRARGILKKGSDVCRVRGDRCPRLAIHTSQLVCRDSNRPLFEVFDVGYLPPHGRCQ